MNVEAVRSLYHDERAELDALVASLDDDELSRPSLCAGWTIGDVILHVHAWEDLVRLPTRAAIPGQATRLAVHAIRALGSTDRLNEQLRRSQSATPRPPTHRHLFDRLAPGSQLAELVVHHQDIRRPLDRPRAIPPDRLRAALDGLRRVPGLGVTRRARGRRWVADDLDWSLGRGPEVRAPAETLLMALAGRISVPHSNIEPLPAGGDDDAGTRSAHCGLTTARLELRPMTRDDLELLIQLNSDPEVMRHITGKATSVNETARELDDALGTRWLVFTRNGHEFLGWVGAIPSADGQEHDIGWRFKRSAWGHGYATEAARQMIDHLFDRGAVRVFAQTMAVNQRSRSVMERLGLRHCRTFHLDVDDPLPGTEHGEVEYEATRASWTAARSS